STRPRPLVVRSIVSSWITTKRPSPQRRTSNSSPVAPHCNAFLNEAIVFSPRRGYPGAPRCPKMITIPVYAPNGIGLHPMITTREEFKGEFLRVHQEISKVIVGYSGIIDDILMAILGRGHVLLEGVPGLGKTKLVQTLSDALHLRSSRIQFTPDLMPADIVGTNVVQENEHGDKFLDFQPGPVFANIILADEI